MKTPLPRAEFIALRDAGDIPLTTLMVFMLPDGSLEVVHADGTVDRPAPEVPWQVCGECQEPRAIGGLWTGKGGCLSCRARRAALTRARKAEQERESRRGVAAF